MTYIEEDFVEHMYQPLVLFIQYASGAKLFYHEDRNELVAMTNFETSRELDEPELAQFKELYDAQMSNFAPGRTGYTKRQCKRRWNW